MTTAESFKVWLETIYISEKTKKPLTTGVQYVTGINALNKKFKLSGEGIFDKKTNLQHIRNLIDKPENFHKDYSSHFNAFLKFRDFLEERLDRNKPPLQRQSNVFKRQQIEVAAVEVVIKYFEVLDYIVVSKEKDNVGWDLEATNFYETLLLEVKGLSSDVTSIELTPNEYKNSKEKFINYRICIVTNALKEPTLNVYKFDIASNCWMNEKKQRLDWEERIGARFWIS